MARHPVSGFLAYLDGGTPATGSAEIIVADLAQRPFGLTAIALLFASSCHALRRYLRNRSRDITPTSDERAPATSGGGHVLRSVGTSAEASPTQDGDGPAPDPSQTTDEHPATERHDGAS